MRVLELASGLAGAYCGKLLADAGADVVKGEPADGDPLRSNAALFEFLNTSKRSVVLDGDGPRWDWPDLVIAGHEYERPTTLARTAAAAAVATPGAGGGDHHAVRLHRAVGRVPRQRVHAAGVVRLERPARRARARAAVGRRPHG